MQIFESAQANTLPLFHADVRETNWHNFVRNVPPCASLATSGRTFHCLQSANSSEITQGLLAAISEDPEQFAWRPVLDGPNGIVPDYTSILFAKGRFARLPFIAGTNLDEGAVFLQVACLSGVRAHRFFRHALCRTTGTTASF